MMKINILAGGPVENLPDLTLYNDHETIWIGVDRGVYTLLVNGLYPQYAFGDFDSVTEEELKVIEQKVNKITKFQPEKDETDLELALNWAISNECTKIRIFGATGGRLDHLFANVHLLLHPLIFQQSHKIEIIDDKNMMYIKQPGTYELEINKDKQYVSFVPLTSAVENLTLKGFKYPLKNRHIPLGSTLCISNELINKRGTYSFSDGILLVIRSAD